ncbi:antirestriction protein ArdA [Lactobacillus sp.]|uniref:antirestriction protein ArdA n=1 Tax=Lactobacillus sp. TaxID=1591 RepID=UPI0019BD2F59|nr:antirestriction protein ArdA [Lactobacillus sp.]MBD5430482.1 antirestriction protein ArdA [Lactobacillus sp.]MBD5430776.1 antirestriction protein ArdA [Lactobacillus sp.]
MKELKNVEIKVFVSNIGAYNAGVLTGQWTTLPVANVNDIFKADQKAFGNVEGYGEEYFITDYEAPFKISEFENLNTLNKLAKALQENNLNTIEDVYNELDNKNEILEEPVEFDEEALELLTSNMSRAEAIRSACFGNIVWSDDYIRYNGYGNLETLTEAEWIDELNYVSDNIIENYAIQNNIDL